MPKFLRPAAPRLFRRHPLAAGLADAVLLDGDRGWNYGNEALQPAFVGSVTSEPTADSPGSRTSGGTNYVTLSPSYNIAAGQFTVSVLWKPISNSGQFVGFLEKSNGSNRELAFFASYTSGNISYYTIGTSLSGDVNYPTAMVNGGTYRLTVTRNAANLISFYVNGRFIASATFSGSTAVSGSAWNLGRNASGGGQHPTAAYGDLFVWPGRCLTADEVMQHAADPWEMLRPARTLLRQSLPPLTATIAGDIPITAKILAELAPLPGGLPHGVLRRGRRGRNWQNVPEELKPVVALAEEWSEADPVARAVEEALAKHARITLRTSAARRDRLIDEAKRAIVAAVERAAEMDDEEALIALL